MKIPVPRILPAAFVAALSLAGTAPRILAHVSYTTTWVGNTYGDNAHHVGNCARAIWVAPEGVLYTASLWDENAGGIGIYQNGQNLGSIGAHGEVQGCSITGDDIDVFACLQGANGGKVGRYNRTTHVRDLMFAVSASIGDSVPGLAISPTNGLLYASDNPGNRIRVFTTAGAWQQDWTVASPGPVAVDANGNVWVAQTANGTILGFTAAGNPLATITMPTGARPSALYFDGAKNQLLVGDEGPDQNIKIYGDLGASPALLGTFGVQGGYLNTDGGAIKGQVGDKRFTRVVGLGKDSAGNLYVSHNCWGGTWDLGRNGATDLHCYDPSGNLLWTLQALNFESNGAPDTASDGTTFYTGKVILTGSGGAGYVANTVDPFTYPNDPRINVADKGRGSDFGLLATVGTHRILMACGQNPDGFYAYHFNAANGYIAIPDVFWGASHERNGFCLDTAGNVWEGRDKTNAIWFNQLTGFDGNGVPIYAAATSTPTPVSIGQLNRIIYLPESDTMILAGGASDWTAVGSRVEVYRGWRAGNTTTPNQVIHLNTILNPKALAAAGNYLFVGYTHTVPNIDAYNLTTGALDASMTSSDPNVYVGNDVDSMYGVRAIQKSNGQYVVTKDDYNGTSMVIHTLNPAPTQATAPILSLAGGTYDAAQSVTISCATTDVSIRYTTDGSTPGPAHGLLYTGPIAITATTTLNAIAYASDLADSPITTAAYIINETNAGAPYFSPLSGFFTSAQSVAIASPTPGASIRYTTNGGTPTETIGTLYSGPITISATTAVKAIAYKPGLGDSVVASSTYTITLPQTSAPTFNPPPGTYSSAQTISLLSVTSGATIRYTTDGSTPTTTTGTLYSLPIPLNTSTLIKAIAYASGYSNSTVASGSYTIRASQTAAPTFSPAGGTYSSGQSVVISSATTGAAIYYTTDGSTPSATAGTPYTGPVTIAATTTLKAIASAAGLADSTVSSATYTITSPQVSAPAFNPAGGTYTSGQSVALSSATPGAAIRYTTDGSTPTSSTGAIYSGPIPVTATTTIKAIAYGNGLSDSAVSSATYVITAPQVAPPVFSPGGGTYSGSQQVSITTVTSGATIRYTTDGSVPSATIGTVYTGPITVGNSTTLQAIGYESGFADSPISSAQYAIVAVGDLPTPWFSQDIGAPQIAGSAGYSAGTFLVAGSGSDINRNADQCQMVYQSCNSDCSITAHVINLTNTNSAAKAGVMVRETLDTGSTEASATLTPANGVTWQYRSTTSGTTSGSRTAGLVAPYWVRVVRKGTTFTAYESPDGITWTQLGTTTIAMATNCYVGLVVSSRNNAALCTASFDNVTVALPPTFAAPAVADGTVGQSFTYSVTAGNSPTSYGAAGLPAGLSIDPRSGQIIGTPAIAGTFVATVTATNAIGTASNTLTLTIAPGSASVRLDGLTTVYDGTAKAVTATTAPAGLPVVITYDGSLSAPYSAGSYAVVATISDPNYQGSTTGTLVIVQAKPVLIWAPPADIVYGTPLGATQLNASASVPGTFAFTPPAGTVLGAGANQTLSAVFTPTDTLDYTSARISTTLTVEPAPATITLGNLSQTYDGQPRAVSAVTSPAGLPVAVTYGGSAVAPVNAGDYLVVAIVTDPNYVGSSTGTLHIAKAVAAISLDPLVQSYDGTPKAVTATTVPAGLAVDLTYDGGTAAPIYPGAHAIVATIDDRNYTGEASGTLLITPAALVRHAPNLNGIIVGSIQVLSPESMVLNHGASLSGDLLLPGSPTVQVNGTPTWNATATGPGATTPGGYTVTLNNGAVLRNIVTQVDAIPMPTVSTPPAPTGTRRVVVNFTGQDPGDFSTVSDLTLNPGAGSLALPPGSYGNIVVNRGATLVLGVAGSGAATNYNVQNLTVNAAGTIEIVGPVVLTLANGSPLDGSIGNSEHPEWLSLQVAAGDLNLNGRANVQGSIVNPTGAVLINGSATVHGNITSDNLSLTGSSLLDGFVQP